MNSKTVNVPAISCHHCVMTIQRELSKLEGVRRVEADAQTKQVTVEWEPPASWEQIAARLTEIDYPPA
jgi:copper chaperone